MSVSPNRSVRPEWLLLEKQDGFSIQLVYVASAPFEWRIEGAVIGQPRIGTWDASVAYAHDGKLTVNPSWWRLSTMALLAYYWLAATGAMMVAAISLAKNWGAPPFFLY